MTLEGIDQLRRRDFLRIGGVTIVGLALPGTLLGCGGGEDESEGASARVLRASQPSDVSTMDPQKQGSMVDMSVLLNMFDMLTRRDDSDELVGSLATSWEAVDPRTWRFELREGVQFHNGEPFNADVVKFSIDRLLDPATESPIVELRYVTGVEVVDDLTVDIVSSRPDPILPAKVSLFGGVMVPPRYIEEQGDDAFAEKPVGTGPFKFVSWQRDSQVVMEANRDYWDGAPQIGQFIVRAMPDPSSSLAALQSGEVDVVGGLTADAAAQIGGSADLEMRTHPGVRTYFIAIDTLSEGPLQDARVRQALNYALDVETLTEALFGGNATPAATLIPQQAFGHDPSVEPYPHDPERARQLLAEAGYPDGFETTLTGQNTESDPVQAIAGQLEQAGIRARANLLDPGTFEERLLKNQGMGLGPMYYIGNTGWTLDAASNLQSYVKPDRPQSRYDNPRASRLVDVEERTVDPEAREAAFAELQQILKEDAPFGYLYQADNLYAVNTRVDWEPNSLGVLTMADASLGSS